MMTAERKEVFGSPDLESLTTSHIERAFLTVRQELKRYSGKTLAYSKSLEMHKAAVALHFWRLQFRSTTQEPRHNARNRRRD